MKALLATFHAADAPPPTADERAADAEWEREKEEEKEKSAVEAKRSTRLWPGLLVAAVVAAAVGLLLLGR